MAHITHARAFANNEVAFLAWQLDVSYLPGCLGFHILRQTCRPTARSIQDDRWPPMWRPRDNATVV